MGPITYEIRLRTRDGTARKTGSHSRAHGNNKRREIAEIDSTFKAKMAEKEVFLKDQIKKALAAGQVDEVQSLEKQFSFELKRLAEDCEAKKEKARLAK